MRKTIFYFLTALTVGYVSEANAQTNDKMEKEAFSEEQKKVLSTIEKMVAGFENKDITKVLSCYEPDATIVFEPGKPIAGMDLFKEAFLQAFTINPVYQFKGHEVFITGDIATHFTPWKMSGTLPDGTLIEQSGLSIAVLKKQKDGTWLILFDNPHGQLLMEK